MYDFIVGIPYSGCEYTSEIPCTREDEAVAIACGAWLGGKEQCFVFMQDAGFLSALNAFIGLRDTYKMEIYTHIEYVIEPEHHKLTSKYAEVIIDALTSYLANNE